MHDVIFTLRYAKMLYLFEFEKGIRDGKKLIPAAVKLMISCSGPNIKITLCVK